MKPGSKHTSSGFRRGPFEHIAWWQFLAFVLLVCLIWADAVLDLPHLLFRLPEYKFQWYRACVLTAMVIVVGFITIGHAYAQQKRVLKGFLKICSYCRRIQVNEEVWHQMESFLADRTLAEFTHGVCPECYRRVMEEAEPPGESAGETGPG